MKRVSIHAVILGVCWMFGSGLQAASQADLRHDAHLRHPIRLVLFQQHTELLTANERSGTLSRIHLDTEKVLEERSVASSLADMIYLENEDQLLLLDDQENRLILLDQVSKGIDAASRTTLPLPTDPRNMAMHPNQQLLAVASRWSRQLTLLERSNTSDHQGTWTLSETIDLSFAPGKMVFVPDQNGLVIADAFNGLLAFMDLTRPSITTVSHLQLNNIAHLSVTTGSEGSSLWLSGESLNGYATTFNPEVTWGVLMDNQVRSIPLAAYLHPGQSPEGLGKVYGMGDETGPGGDPGKILIKQDGTLITALQGVDRIAFRPQLSASYTYRIPVGDRPMDMVMNPEETRLYVVNQFSDSISVIHLEQLEVQSTLSLGPQPALSEIDRGERLFFDANLSLRGWYSCHSCHTDGHTTGLLNDNLGDDHFGSPKRILTLLGAAPTAPFSWLGKVENLEGQIAKSLEKTMLHRGSFDDKASLMAKYLETLPAPPSVIKARGEFSETRFLEGKEVFRSQGCQECHRAPYYTSEKRFDVGLQDKAGHREFNPPSLLGISQRDTFLHDNRASSLESVLFDLQHPEPRQTPLTAPEREALLYFLNSL